MLAPLPSLPMDVQAIKECIPHRYPFLLIDKVLDIKPNESIVAVKNVSVSDPILQGHFPEFPVYPGVLMVEGMAQASAVLAQYSLEGGFSDILLTQIFDTRFRRKVVPGEQLHYHLLLEKKRGPFAWFQGTAEISSEAVASCRFSALVK